MAQLCKPTPRVPPNGGVEPVRRGPVGLNDQWDVIFAYVIMFLFASSVDHGAFVLSTDSFQNQDRGNVPS